MHLIRAWDDSFCSFRLWLLRSPLCSPERQLQRRSKDKKSSNHPAFLSSSAAHEQGWGVYLPCQLCPGGRRLCSVIQPSSGPKTDTSPGGLLRLSSLFYSGDDGTDQGKGPVYILVCCRTQHTDDDHRGLLCNLPTQCHQTWRWSSNVTSPGAFPAPIPTQLEFSSQFPQCLSLPFSFWRLFVQQISLAYLFWTWGYRNERHNPYLQGKITNCNKQPKMGEVELSEVRGTCQAELISEQSLERNLWATLIRWERSDVLTRKQYVKSWRLQRIPCIFWSTGSVLEISEMRMKRGRG